MIRSPRPSRSPSGPSKGPRTPVASAAAREPAHQGVLLVQRLGRPVPGPPQPPASPPSQRLRGKGGGTACSSGAGRVHLGGRPVHLAHEPAVWRWRGAPSQAARRPAGGEGQGRSLWTGGDLGRRGCCGTSTGRRQALRQQRAFSGAGSRAVSADPATSSRRQFGASAESCRPYLGGGGPQFPPIRAAEHERARTAGRPGGGQLGGGSDGRSAARSPPQVDINARALCQAEGRAAGAAEGQVGESADSRTAQTARDVTAGAGATLARSGWPVPGGSGVTGGTGAPDAAWGGRARRRNRLE